ncbi:hypothetical protein A2870_04215 [Candidatus Curtissbacteria bacterium RIFCSPHIGHO2_01_FULL_41_11]|uniref:Polymerase nucleotidyl transferase domain-containing protein n=1 Tax=Candidatus Curtissbacteria bacterium RIFCSPHIGHO2_01_FULL_41_11 TaxID=1797711 RepID=A0A1F5G6M5_9BACT|nr:MAG: hypothetical protein A2870_04215 [Candidatus Curtissbacteria bacterium RIFCSPHIGHO2_01_FULL_41_11]
MRLKQAILATLAYHDIFDYPLTAQQIHRYLIIKASKTALEKELAVLFPAKEFYSLTNRQKIALIRKKRQKYSNKKLKRAYFYASFLKQIPSIKMVAISGALAMENSHKSDDIDLVIVTAKNTLWTTRFLANILLFPFKRKPHSSRLITSHYALATNNKACLNIFLDESNLKISPRNIYTAHELCQLKSLIDINKTYSRLIKANLWIYKYLPNWEPEAERQSRNVDRRLRLKALVFSRSALVLENFLKKFQLFYMRKRITSEQIGEHQLFFHPSNTQEWVLKEYQKRLKKLKLAKSF